MNNKLLGGILLILGTCIGAGMLALPVATAYIGFLPSLFIFIGCWLLMLFGALATLEVCLWLPRNTNIITMTHKTLGRWAQIVAWLSYLLLLYSIMCAYIESSAEVTELLFNFLRLPISFTAAAIIISGLFALIVLKGIRSVDHINRFLTITLFILFLFLFKSTASFIHPDYLLSHHFKLSAATLLIIIASFTFSIIIPSLRDYFDDNIKKLRLAIIIGSAIPLIIYFMWVGIVHGLLPLHGKISLISLASHHETTRALTNALTTITQNQQISNTTTLFATFCTLTSLLGVSLCLSDFLRDGLQLADSFRSQLIAVALAFFPPLIIVLIAPGIFVKAVEYAGISCVILCLWLPILMLYQGRYRLQLNHNATYQLITGKYFLQIARILLTVFVVWILWIHL